MKTNESKFTVTIHKPDSDKSATEVFDNEDRAARWAAHCARQGYIVEFNGKTYTPTNAQKVITI